MEGTRYVIPDLRKRFRARANGAMRKLRKEEASGYIRDGSGNRYRVGVYFLLAGDLERAAEAFDWFEGKFEDDVGEPLFFLYGALTAYRRGDLTNARSRLANAMLSNIFLLPFLWGDRIDTSGMWLSSNWEEEGYIATVREFLDEPTPEERQWIASEWNSAPFVTLREGYISTFRALDKESDYLRRSAILNRWMATKAEHFDQLERQRDSL